MKNSVLKSILVLASLSAMSALAAGTPDGLVTSKAKLSLWTTAGIRSTTVHVDTDDGTVTLYGKVPSNEQKALAEKTTREVAGVRGVRNLLQVVAEAEEKRVDRADKDIQELGEKQLKADLSLRDSSISVKSVDKGVVLLTGEARTFSDHLRAVEIIDRMPGVHRVASEVKGPDAFGSEERVTFLAQPNKTVTKAKNEGRSSSSDMRISASVKLRLLTTSQLPSNEISVDTHDGVVTLFGIVPTADVKKTAAFEAGKVSGVLSVQNQLEVVASSQKKMVDAKDSDITGDLAIVFKNRPEFKSVETSVKNGTVRLTGTVSSGWDEVNAVRLARNVAGVRAVEDHLKLDEKAETTRRE